jgi:hypothetical protein
LSTLSDIKQLESFALEHGFLYAIRPHVYVKGEAGRREDDLTYRREVGILWRKKWRAAANSHRVIPQTLKYGNFF